ncbi:MAG: hypothetical protein ACXACR_05545 [Candidatus Hodarchaeales archaeon]|jgi:hypothetical protein
MSLILSIISDEKNNWRVPLLILILAGVVYALYGFNGDLTRDSAIFIYQGQQMAEGVPPYVSIFDVKTPLTGMISGYGVMISRNMGWDELLIVRLVFYVFGCFGVVSVYLLAKNLFNSRLIGLFSSLTLLTFPYLVMMTASGPRPKVAVILFATLCLLFTVQKKWFKAGLTGSVSFWFWQPSGLIPLVVFFLSWIQSRRNRIRNTLMCGVGILIPIILISLYFYFNGAFEEMMDGAFLYIFRYGKFDQETTFIGRIITFGRGINGLSPNSKIKLAFSFIFLVGGSIATSYIYFWRRSQANNVTLKDTLTKDNFAPVLLSFPLLLIWTFFDFQGPPDLFPLLPYISIGYGYFLYAFAKKAEEIRMDHLKKDFHLFFIIVICAILFFGSVAIAISQKSGGVSLNDQKKAAFKIESRFGSESKILSLGQPEVLVLLKRTNPNSFLFIPRSRMHGFENYIHETTPGGFGGWIKELDEYNPDVISYGKSMKKLKGEHINNLFDWIDQNYREETVGPFIIYVKEEIATNEENIDSEINE